MRVGENTIDQDDDCEVSRTGRRVCAPPPQDIRIEEMVIHPNYRKQKIANDIALIRLSRSVSLDNRAYVNTICLPESGDSKAPNEDRFLVAGWGRTETSPWSNDLMKAGINRNSIEDCREVFKDNEIPDEPIICAGGSNLIDTCRGDSGGPLFWKAYIHGGSRYVEYGITGRGFYGCGELLNGKTAPAMYTSVAYHLDWIKRTMH